MQIIDKIINKCGTDKVLHFLVGAWITSMFSPFGWLGIIIGTVTMLILSFIKEIWLDDVFDKKDIIAACIGSGVSTLFYLLIA